MMFYLTNQEEKQGIIKLKSVFSKSIAVKHKTGLLPLSLA